MHFIFSQPALTSRRFTFKRYILFHYCHILKFGVNQGSYRKKTGQIKQKYVSAFTPRLEHLKIHRRVI